MKDVDKYCKVFKKAEQIGRLYLLPLIDGKNASFRIYVLPEGEKVIENGGINPPLNKDQAEVYGVTGGQHGFAKTYGWLHEGKWQTDFEEIYQKRFNELEESKIKRKNAEEAAKSESDKRIKSLLANYA